MPGVASVTMETPRERARSFLHAQGEWLAMFASRHEGDIWPERDGRVAGAVGALRAVGLLAPEEADKWEARVTTLGAETPVASEPVRRQAAELLAELLEAVPAGKDAAAGTDASRFLGALAALAQLGAAGAEWDERLRQRLGWSAETSPGLNAGGTEQDLIAVLAEPPEAVDGMRVLYALRFADGISFTLHGERSFEDWQPWEYSLRDDAGTTYAPGAAGGGGVQRQISFRSAPPHDASWVELVGVARSPLRLAL